MHSLIISHISYRLTTWSQVENNRYISLPIFPPIFKHFTIIGYRFKKKKKKKKCTRSMCSLSCSLTSHSPRNNSLQDYFYSAFYSTIVAEQFYRQLSFYNKCIYCGKFTYLTYSNNNGSPYGCDVYAKWYTVRNRLKDNIT